MAWIQVQGLLLCLLLLVVQSGAAIIVSKSGPTHIAQGKNGTLYYPKKEMGRTDSDGEPCLENEKWSPEYEEHGALPHSTLDIKYQYQNSINDSNKTCPLWFTNNCNSSNSCSCKCGSKLSGAIQCNQTSKEVLLAKCYCMSAFNKNSQQIPVVGFCMYGCFQRGKEYWNKGLQVQIPKYNISDLDRFCKYTNRRGLMCGQCMEGYYPPVYSNELKCVKCTNLNIYYNIVKFLLIAFLPVTVLLFIVIHFRINANSPQLNAFIFVSHIISYLPSVESLVESLNPGINITIQVIFGLYGIWNLDFFKGLIPPVCFDINTRQALGLDYGVAIYPLVLLGTAFAFIQLHDRNCRVIVWIWRPFHQCFARSRQQWDVRNSIIHAFATFLPLSYFKILTTTVLVAVPIQLYDVDGNVVGGVYSYYDAEVNIVDNKHVIYVIFVLIIFLFLIILPVVLLVLYPFSCFQKCVDCCHLRCHALQAFMDTFQGYYRDGTNDNPDRRWFAAVYLVARITLFTIFGFTYTYYYYPVATLVLILLGLMVVVLQPYKSQYAAYNVIDALLILMLAMWYGSIQMYAAADLREPKYKTFAVVISSLILLCPLVYISAVFIHWLIFKAHYPQRMFNQCQLWRRLLLSERSMSEMDPLLGPERMNSPTPNNSFAEEPSTGAFDAPDSY